MNVQADGCKPRLLILDVQSARSQSRCRIRHPQVAGSTVKSNPPPHQSLLRLSRPPYLPRRPRSPWRRAWSARPWRCRRPVGGAWRRSLWCSPGWTWPKTGWRTSAASWTRRQGTESFQSITWKTVRSALTAEGNPTLQALKAEAAATTSRCSPLFPPSQSPLWWSGGRCEPTSSAAMSSWWCLGDTDKIWDYSACCRWRKLQFKNRSSRIKWQNRRRAPVLARWRKEMQLMAVDRKEKK